MSQPNVDPAEIEKFDAIAQEWWDPQGKMGPLHKINPLRLEFIQTHTTLMGRRTLDIGCGGGILSESLAKEGAIVTGVDMSQEVIQVAKQHASTSSLSIDYIHTNIEAFAEKNARFDVITCMELLEHVPSPADLITACTQLLEPGGHIIFSTINRNMKSFLGAIVAAEYIMGWLPKGTHHYKKLIRPSELTTWATQTGLVLTSMQGISYHPTTHDFSLSKDVSINYLMCFTKPKEST